MGKRPLNLENTALVASNALSSHPPKATTEPGERPKPYATEAEVEELRKLRARGAISVFRVAVCPFVDTTDPLKSVPCDVEIPIGKTHCSFFHWLGQPFPKPGVKRSVEPDGDED